MDKFKEEVLAFRNVLLKEFDPEQPLVLHTHLILCATHANEFVKLGQYDNITVEGIEYGHCGLKSFIKVQDKKYELWTKAKVILKDLSYDYP